MDDQNLKRLNSQNHVDSANEDCSGCEFQREFQRHVGCTPWGRMTQHTRTAHELNQITAAIIRCAIRVHRALGPGLLESAYHVCLAYELIAASLEVVTDQPIPLVYGDVRLPCAYKADVVVNQCVLIEIKAQDAIAGIHIRQLNTYLKLANLRVGLLLNFGAATMKNGIHRVVNDFPRL